MAVSPLDPTPSSASASADEALDLAARPLLELIQRLTGLETTFVTEIDWDRQTQEVLVARNTGAIEVPEGSVVEWADSMCRWTFLSGKASSDDVPGDFPGSIGADAVGMRTFFAVPVVDDGATIGTVCGASGRAVELTDETLGHMELIAEALTRQLALHREVRDHLARAEQAEVLAHTDELTGLANRREFTSKLEVELARSGRHHTPVSVLVLDIDHFKSVNDGHGHDAGDAVLRALGDVLRRACRTEDVPARLGGDEFAVLLPECGGEQAAAVGDRIRREFAARSDAIGFPCSVSVGTSSSEGTERRRLLTAADAAMYRAKSARA